jgi:sugar phosphate isomerase/epimerase
MTITRLPPDRLCIHQATLMQCDFRQSIDCFARYGVTQTAVWKDKLDEVGTRQGARILHDAGVASVSLCAGGFLTATTKAGQQKILDENRRWLDQAAAIGATSMVAITGGLAAGEIDINSARKRALDRLSELVPLAREAGVKIALEPLHPMVCGKRSVISTLGEANDMLDTLDMPDVLGIALDSYSLWWDSNLQHEIARAAGRIINLHVSDWLKDTSDTRLDRGMMGDGHIDNRSIRSWVEATGFTGPSEVEIFSEDVWWRGDPDELVATIIERAACYL